MRWTTLRTLGIAFATQGLLMLQATQITSTVPSTHLLCCTAGVVAGLVSYIVSNGLNYVLDYAEDAWERWRDPEGSDAGQVKHATGNFGRHGHPGGPGGQSLGAGHHVHIGNRTSLER